MIKESLITVISRIIQALSSFVIVIAIARFLGPHDQGIYSLMKNFVNILVIFLDLGISTSLIYFIGHKKYSTSILIWNSIFLALINGVIGIVIACLLYFSFPSFFKEINIYIFGWGIISLPFFLLFSFLFTSLLGLQKVMIYNKFIIIYGLISVIIITTLSYFFPKIMIVFIAILISLSIIILLISFYFVKSNFISRPTFNREVLFSSIRWGIKGQLGNILQFFNYRLDIFLINYFLNPVSVGLYFVAVNIAESILLTTKSIAVVILSKVANSENNEIATKLTSIASRLGFALNLIVVVLLAIFSPRIIPYIFGEAYIDSISPLLFLLPGILFFGITNILTSFIIGVGFPKYNTYIAGMSLIFTIILDLLLIPKFGINGAAIASSVSYIFSSFFTIYYFRKLSKGIVPMKDIIFLRNEDIREILKRIP